MRWPPAAGVCCMSMQQHLAVQRRIQMRFAFMCALLVSASVGISACNKAESPDKVQTDVAKATNEAAEKNAKADETMKQTEAQASQDLAKEKADAAAKAADKSVGAVADAAVTETEGATKVALAKCAALRFPWAIPTMWFL